jgi:hypothetical protein
MPHFSLATRYSGCLSDVPLLFTGSSSFRVGSVFLFWFVLDVCQREFTTKSTKDTKNGIRSKLQHPQPVEYKDVRLDCD